MLSKKELLDLRKNGEIIKSSELINYYIENKKLIDEKYYDLVFNLLVEYFLYDKYDLIDVLLKIENEDSKLYPFFELLDAKFNRHSTTTLHQKLNKYPTRLYSYRVEGEYVVKAKKFIDLSKITFIKPAKIALLNKASEYDIQLPYYLLGMLYKEEGKMDEAITYFKKSANNSYRPAALELVDYYKDDLSERNYYLKKAVNKNDKDEIFNLINELKKDSKTTLDAYKYLLCNICLDSKFSYELACWYENGIIVDENMLLSYILYLCSDGYSDSNIKYKEFKNILKQEYREKINSMLEEDILFEEEKRIKEEKRLLKEKEKRDAFNKEFDKLELSYYDIEDGGIRRGETKSNYNKKVSLYKKAKDAAKIETVLKYLKESAELGHIAAKISLFKYYKDIEADLAEEYLTEASKKSIKALEMLKEYKEEKRQIAKAKKTDEKEFIDSVINDREKFKELLYKTQNDYETEKLIDRTLKKKKLSKTTLEIISEVADEGNQYANLFLFDYYNDVESNVGKRVYYIQQACKNFDIFPLKKLIYYCCITGSNSIATYFTKEMIHHLLNLNSYESDILYFQGIVLSNKDLCKIFEVKHNGALALEKFLYVYIDKPDFANKNIVVVIGKLYEEGNGVKKDLEKALYYYELYNKDSIRAINLRKRINDEKEQKYRNVNNKKIIEKYFNSDFDDYLNENPEFSLMINERYFSLNSEELEKELICRNELLEKDVKITSLYKNNSFSGFHIKVGMEEMEQMEKERIAREKAKKEQLERERLERQKILEADIKRKQEELERIRVEKQKKAEADENTKVSSNLNSKNIVSEKEKISVESKSENVKTKEESNNEPMTTDNPYYKTLGLYTDNNLAIRDGIIVAKLRRLLKYPLGPNLMPKVDEFGKKHSKREIQKQFEKDLELNKEKEKEYYDRLYSCINQIRKDESGYRKRVLGLKNQDRIILLKDYCIKCEELYNEKATYGNKIYISVIDITFKDSKKNTISGNTAVERMMAHAPNYAEVVIKISGDLYYDKDFTDTYYDAYTNFENSELTKLGTWQEYSSSDSDVGARIHVDSLNDNRRDGNQRIKASRAKETHVKDFMLKMFNSCDLIATKTFTRGKKEQYVEGVVTKIKYEFKWNYK